MTRPFGLKPVLIALILGTASFAGVSCESGGVGDPCIPEDEYQNRFSGFAAGEVNVESRSFQCQTRVCLVNHFEGRVSCPYGQTEEQVDSLPGTDPARCRVPGTDGSDPADEITVPVEAQFVRRQADANVYCSCRCDGPDANARYCDCPSGYSCTELVADLGLPGSQLAGSYCIKDGSNYIAGETEGAPRCRGGTTEGGTYCGNGGVNP